MFTTLNNGLLCLLLMVAGMTVYGPAVQAETRHHFRHLTTDQGLSSNWVGALLQDRNGMIWIGTSDGLCSYDGLSFRTIPGPGRTSGVYALLEGDSCIWVGQDNGLYLYDAARDSLQSLNSTTDQGTQVSAHVSWIGCDRTGDIWVSTFGQGIFNYSPATHRLRQYLLPNHGTQAAGMLTDADGQIWAISKDMHAEGLMRFNRHTDSFESVRLHDPTASSGTMVETRGLALMQDCNSNIWIGTWDHGALCFDPHTLHIVDSIPTSVQHMSHIHSLLEYAPGIIYVGSDDGLCRYDTRTGQVEHFEPDELDRHSLNDQFIYPLMRDQEGGLWVGTYYGGINYANPRSEVFRSYLPSAYRNSISGNVISCFYEDDSGCIWIGSDDGGLSSLQHGVFVNYDHNEVRNIHALCMHRGLLWIGTYTDGIDVMDPVTGRTQHHAEILDAYDNSLGNSCYALYNDRQDRLWVGTYTGLCLYDDTTGRFVNVQDFGTTPYCIYQDNDGNIWCCTDGAGLWRCDAVSGLWKQYRDASGVNVNNIVNTMCCDSEGRLWAGTQDGLLYYSRADNTFRLSGPLCDYPDVQGVVADGNTLWIATTRGLLHYMPDLGDSIQVFTTDDGLYSTSYQPDAILRSSDGRIYLGTTQGMQAFYPSRVRLNQVVPHIIFTGLDLGPHAQDRQTAAEQYRLSRTTGTIELDYRHNSIGISFAALSYASPAKNQYAVWLEGFNPQDQWSKTGNANWVNYTNLAPGSYVLHVRAANNDNVWSTTDARMRIVIHPPFYWTATARIIYVLLSLIVIALVIWGILYRSNMQHRQELERLRHQNAQKLHEARMQFFTTIAHEIRTPVSLIIAPLDKVRKQAAGLSSAMVNDLAIVDRNSRRLLELVNQLLDFRKVENGMSDLSFSPCSAASLLQSIADRFHPGFEQKGIQFDVSLPDTDFSPCLDSEAITKMVSNLLSNALKYTHDRVTLSCTVLPDLRQWTISVADNGPGIPPDEQQKVFRPFYQSNTDKPGTGIGLSIVQGVASAHHGTVNMLSQTDASAHHGTTFTITLPTDLTATTTVETKTATPTTPSLHTPPPVTADGELPCTLIVDDNADMLQFLAECMQPHYRLLTASDGAEALRLLGQHQVNLIVSDWMMPTMDGEQLCRAVRQNPLTSHIPFIMLTAKTDDSSKVRGMDCGADAYIEKPFSIDYLQACIGNLLELRRMLWHKFSSQPSATISEIASTPLDSDLLQRMQQYIEAHLSDSDLSVDVLAQHLGISRSNLFAKIKSISDASPNEMIQTIRLKRAASLLSQGNLRISEIAYMVGFSSPSYFSKCFQRQFGVKPGDYVKSA